MASVEGVNDYIDDKPHRCKKCGSKMYANRNVFGLWVSSECANCGYVID